MFILDTPRRFDGLNLRLPLYHRGHLSLFEGAQVSIVALPGPPRKPQFPELILSTIAADSWEDLWQVRVTMRDRIGLVRDVLRVLSAENLNVLTAESTSMERDSLHIAEMIVDATDYVSPFEDKENAVRRAGNMSSLRDLERAFVAAMLEDIALDRDGRPMVSTQRLDSLHNCQKSYLEYVRLKRMDSVQHRPVKDTSRVVRTNESNVSVRLPETVRNLLTDCLGPIGNDPEAMPRYLLISDTQGRFLRAYFTPGKEQLLSVTIKHREEAGALAAITSALVSADINVLTMLSRLTKQGEKAETEFVLSWTRQTDLPAGRERELLTNSLSTSELIERFEVELRFGHRYKQSENVKPFQKLNPPTLPPKPADLAPARSVKERLEEWEREYMKRTREPKPSPEDFLRLQLAREFLNEERRCRREQEVKQLFISSTFHRENDWLKAITQLAEAAGFRIVTGEDLTGQPTKAQGVIDKIKNCSHFLGVWATDGGLPMAGEHGTKNCLYCPSPWLVWEWGVAQAFGKRWKLVIDRQIHPDSWQRISGDAPHIHFDRTDFESKVNHALQSLQAL